MKKIRLFLTLLLTIIFAPAIQAQQPTEAQQAAYQKFLANRTTNEAVAYQAAKDYVQSYDASAAADDKIVAYLRKWMASYEKTERRKKLLDQLAAKQIEEAFQSAPTVLNDYPDDVGLVFDLAREGTTYVFAGHPAVQANAVAYAKRGVELLRSGKSFNPDKPLTDEERNRSIAFLAWGLGQMLAQSAPNEALDYFFETLRLWEAARTNPLTYAGIAEIYDRVYYAPSADKYKADCQTDEQKKTQACVEAKSRTDAIVDHLIDALARAVAYSKAAADEGKHDKFLPAWMETLMTYYKYRHQDSDAGLKELIDGITAKPMMERVKE